MSRDGLTEDKLTGWGRAHVCWAGLIVAGFGLMVAGAALSGQPEGTCSGIGFGCQLSGPDLAVLILIFLGPPVAVVLGLGHAALAVAHALQRRHTRTAAELPSSVTPQPGRR